MQAMADASGSTRAAGDVPLTLFRQMVRLRAISARMVELQRSDAIASHASCIGEEAVVVAATVAMREPDWVFPGAREWGAAIVRGMPVANYVHHAFGTALDPAKGHAAPDHVPGKAWRVVPASGIVAAHVTQAVGAAWAAKSRKADVAVLAMFGDGATSTGDFHNAMNFAGVFKAPAVLLCRNNGRALSTPTSRQTKSESFAAKAVAYGVASARVDGSDPVAVFAVVSAAVARAAAGKGPTLIEAVTSPVVELPRGADVFALGDGDPLVALRARLERDKILDKAAYDAMKRDAREEIDAAVADAAKAGALAAATLFEDVYARIPAHLSEQKEMSTWRR